MVKRTKKDTTIVEFQVPTEFVEDIKKTRKQTEKEFFKNVEDLRTSFTRLKFETQSELLKYRKESPEARIEKITSELEEAFDLVWPKFDALEKTLSEAKKEVQGDVLKIDKRHSEAVEKQTSELMQVAKLLEKRHQSVLKILGKVRESIPKVIPYDDSSLLGEIKNIKKILDEVGKYEYGSSLQILVAGVPLSFTGQINFKSGFTVVQNGQGVDVSANGTGGGLGYLALKTGAINNTNTTFTFASTPTIVVVNGASYINGSGVTISGTTATLDNPPGTGGSVYALG